MDLINIEHMHTHTTLQTHTNTHEIINRHTRAHGHTHITDRNRHTHKHVSADKPAGLMFPLKDNVEQFNRTTDRQRDGEITTD